MNREAVCEVLAILIEAGEKPGGLRSFFRVAERAGPEYLAELEAACLEALKAAKEVMEGMKDETGDIDLPGSGEPGGSGKAAAGRRQALWAWHLKFCFGDFIPRFSPKTTKLLGVQKP